LDRILGRCSLLLKAVFSKWINPATGQQVDTVPAITTSLPSQACSTGRG
jgi:hypothetical protein